MSATATPGPKLIAPPADLESWRQCEADLQQRRQANEAERGQIAVQRQDMALAAARGDPSAQKRIARLAARDAELHLAGTSLTQGLAVAAQEIGSQQIQAAQQKRTADLVKLRENLLGRLAVVAEVERRLRDVTPLLDRLGTITGEIEEAHAKLGGKRPILSPLAQEAVGGRLAEFMAGSGFSDWLPLPRPEIRSALTSWVGAEQDVQESYHLAI
jgi:hypothetical protein